MRAVCPKLVVIAAVLVLGSVVVAWAELPAGTFVDLTHAFDGETIFWPTEQGFVLEKEFDGVTDKGYYYAANKFCTAEHGGTHADAPVHFSRGGRTVDAIPLEQLLGNAIVVDVAARAEADRDYQVQVGDFLDWEKQHGRIPAGSIVLLRTGFGRFWPDRTRYMGTNERGKDAVAKLHFPGLHPDAARWLALPDPRGALRARRPGLRERREPRAAPSDGGDGHRAADEDQRWQRWAAAHHRDRAEVSAGGSTTWCARSGRGACRWCSRDRRSRRCWRRLTGFRGS
jgi:kynurenine formamidase